MRHTEFENGRLTGSDAFEGMVLRCTECHGGDGEAPGGALTKPERRPDDPPTVVRCAVCGKRHNTDSLEFV